MDLKNIYGSMGISPEVYDYCEAREESLRDRFSRKLQMHSKRRQAAASISSSEAVTSPQSSIQLFRVKRILISLKRTTQESDSSMQHIATI